MSNLKNIITLYGAEAIAKHLGVSKSSVDKYRAKGYLSNINHITKLGELDVNFPSDCFIQDFKNKSKNSGDNNE